MTHRFPSLRQRAARPAVRAVLILSLAMATGAFATAAARAAEGGLTISDPWVRAVMPPSLPAAGYFTLSNKSAKAATLVGASSPACQSVMLHQSMNMNGMDKMVMIKSVAIPAGGQIKFAPGGYHLMCMSPSKDVTPGHSVPITLRFEDGGTITASFAVHGATGQ